MRLPANAWGLKPLTMRSWKWSDLHHQEASQLKVSPGHYQSCLVTVLAWRVIVVLCPAFLSWAEQHRLPCDY